MRGLRPEPVIRARKVISLPGSDRRRTIVPDLVNHGFEVVDAIDGSRITEPGRLLDLRRFKSFNIAPPKSGEIGCVLSHLSLYEEHSSEEELGDDEWVIVAEDDAVLSPRFERDIYRVLARCSTLDFAILANGVTPMDIYYRDAVTRNIRISPVEPPVISIRNTPHMRKVGFVNLADKKNAEVPACVWCTFLYAFNGRGARRFLRTMGHRPYWVADSWKLFSSMGLRIGLVRPNMGHVSSDVTSEIREGVNAYDPELGLPVGLREKLAIRTRLRQAPQVVSVGMDDLRGRCEGHRR